MEVVLAEAVALSTVIVRVSLCVLVRAKNISGNFFILRYQWNPNLIKERHFTTRSMPRLRLVEERWKINKMRSIISPGRSCTGD